MTGIRYYTDEHVSRAVIGGLRQRGVDVLSAPEANRIGVPDHEQLAFALAEGRVLLTYDTDYLGLHAAGVNHAGIVYANLSRGNYRPRQFTSLVGKEPAAPELEAVLFGRG